MTQTPQRLDWIDATKGAAMIAVVIYHVILGFESAGMLVNTTTLRYIEAFLTAFATPPFFLMAGYFIERSVTKAGYKKYIRSAVNFILYPYILWAIIQMGVKILFASFVNKAESFDPTILFFAPPAQFWFLHALFFAQILYCAMHKYHNKNHLLIAAILFVVSALINPIYFAADIVRSLGFLLIGVYFARTEFLTKALNAKTLSMSGAALFLTFPIYVFVAMPSGFEGQSNVIGGIAGTLILCAALLKYGAPKILQILGKYSMYIYVMHIMAIVPFRVVLMKIGIDIPLLSIAICASAGLMLPLIAAIIMEKIKISKFFGIKAVNHFQKDPT